VPTLSVIIPTLNAEAHLPACLERMRPADELIVVDGGSSDGTVAMAREAGARLIVSPRGRGTQLRTGGEAAHGDWLLFLHADTLPGPNWPAAVTAHTTHQPDKAGCFRFRLANKSRQARWIERAVAVRVGLLGLPYGDQGLLVPRSIYEEIGGYRPLALMEDVDLVRRLGRRRIAHLEEHASTSAEKWLRDGWLRRSARNVACLGLYSLGVSPERLARIYG
jgi:rSAM/selenodomain-associated transferase 2